MKIQVYESAQQLGQQAAAYAAQVLGEVIGRKGKARIALSTGASQFEFFKAFVQMDVDWSRVEMFHLDEYVNLPESHPASFRKYLKERFVSIVNPGIVHFVNGEGDLEQSVRQLNEEISKEPIDLALIGIGENAHIAFNDPPADFATEDPYIIVNLDERCRQQQVGEGWFATVAEVPAQAVSMSVQQIMKSRVIISCVPYQVKAQAVKLTLEEAVTPNVPATILKTHPNWTLCLDQESASEVKDKLPAL